MSKKGFTLAEVMITMGIIGVVAALTIPSLSTAYQKRVMTTQLQKAYAELSQAGAMALADEHGDNFRNSQILRNGDFIRRYVNKSGSHSFASSYETDLDDNESFSHMMDYCSDCSCGKTKAGASVCVGSNGDGYLDINGTKGPNKEGVDLFMIGFGRDGAIGDYDHYLRKIIRADWDIDVAR